MHNPFKPNLPVCRPSPRGRLRRSSAPPVPAPDHDCLRSVVHRRLALRLGMSMTLAAAVADLAGIGPSVERGVTR